MYVGLSLCSPAEVATKLDGLPAVLGVSSAREMRELVASHPALLNHSLTDLQQRCQVR